MFIYIYVLYIYMYYMYIYIGIGIGISKNGDPIYQIDLIPGDLPAIRRCGAGRIKSWMC